MEDSLHKLVGTVPMIYIFHNAVRKSPCKLEMTRKRISVLGFARTNVIFYHIQQWQCSVIFMILHIITHTVTTKTLKMTFYLNIPKLCQFSFDFNNSKTRMQRNMCITPSIRCECVNQAHEAVTCKKTRCASRQCITCQRQSRR